MSETTGVLASVSEHGSDMHEVLGLVLGARLADKPAAKSPGEVVGEVDELLQAVDWKVSDDAPPSGSSPRP
ncbi:hypothetical protein ACWGCW_14410 [Streptomyces sp. NPDC054933]